MYDFRFGVCSIQYGRDNPGANNSQYTCLTYIVHHIVAAGNDPEYRLIVGIVRSMQEGSRPNTAAFYGEKACYNADREDTEDKSDKPVP